MLKIQMASLLIKTLIIVLANQLHFDDVYEPTLLASFKQINTNAIFVIAPNLILLYSCYLMYSTGL